MHHEISKHLYVNSAILKIQTGRNGRRSNRYGFYSLIYKMRVFYDLLHFRIAQIKDNNIFLD